MSLKQALLCHFINSPVGLSLSWDSESLEGRLWLCISNTQQRAQLCNSLKSYHLLSIYGYLGLHICESSLQPVKGNSYPIWTGEALVGTKKLIMVPSYTRRRWWDLKWSSAPSKVSDLTCFIDYWQKFGKLNSSKLRDGLQMTQTRSARSHSLCLVGQKEVFRNHRKGLGMSEWRYTHHLGHSGDRMNLGNHKRPHGSLSLLEREGASRVWMWVLLSYALEKGSGEQPVWLSYPSFPITSTPASSPLPWLCWHLVFITSGLPITTPHHPPLQSHPLRFPDCLLHHMMTTVFQESSPNHFLLPNSLERNGKNLKKGS